MGLLILRDLLAIRGGDGSKKRLLAFPFEQSGHEMGTMRRSCSRGKFLVFSE